MSFCAVPAFNSIAVMAAIAFVFASVASLAVLALVVTPPLTRA
jgi:hypothetical protein